MSETNLFQLHMELRFFGLNPQDWDLMKVSPLTFIIQHKTDTGFSFQGIYEFQNKKPRWKKIEVFSI